MDPRNVQYMAVREPDRQRIVIIEVHPGKPWVVYAWLSRESGGGLAEWIVTEDRSWPTQEAAENELRYWGWKLVPCPKYVLPRINSKEPNDPIALPPDADARQTIERIAHDLIRLGDRESRRQGRRLLGALEAMWAEDGADLEEPAS